MSADQSDEYLQILKYLDLRNKAAAKPFGMISKQMALKPKRLMRWRFKDFLTYAVSWRGMNHSGLFR